MNLGFDNLQSMQRSHTTYRAESTQMGNNHDALYIRSLAFECCNIALVSSSMYITINVGPQSPGGATVVSDTVIDGGLIVFWIEVCIHVTVMKIIVI